MVKFNRVWLISVKMDLRTYVRLAHMGTERKEGTVCTGTKDAVKNLTYDLQREESDVRTRKENMQHSRCWTCVNRIL